MKLNTVGKNDIKMTDTEKIVIMPYSQTDIAIHDHQFFEFVYILAGTTTHNMEGNISELKEGDYFIIEWGKKHSYSGSRNLKLVNCLFLPEIVDDTLKNCRSFEELIQGSLIKFYGPYIQKNPVNTIFHDNKKRVLPVIEVMQKEYEEKLPGYLEILHYRLTEILLLILREIGKNQAHFEISDVIREVLLFVDENYQEEISLSNFCEKKYYNLAYISRKFKAEMGMNFKKYLQKKRVIRGCELLTGTNLRVAEIAHKVGYNDEKYFTKVFEKYMKMTPVSYRKHGG